MAYINLAANFIFKTTSMCVYSYRQTYTMIWLKAKHGTRQLYRLQVTD